MEYSVFYKRLFKKKSLMEIIEKYPEKPWEWCYISRNPNITMEFINKHPEKPWVWEYISQFISSILIFPF